MPPPAARRAGPPARSPRCSRPTHPGRAAIPAPRTTARRSPRMLSTAAANDAPASFMSLGTGGRTASRTVSSARLQVHRVRALQLGRRGIEHQVHQVPASVLEVGKLAAQQLLELLGPRPHPAGPRLGRGGRACPPPSRSRAPRRRVAGDPGRPASRPSPQAMLAVAGAPATGRCARRKRSRFHGCQRRHGGLRRAVTIRQLVVDPRQVGHVVAHRENARDPGLQPLPQAQGWSTQRGSSRARAAGLPTPK